MKRYKTRINCLDSYKLSNRNNPFTIIKYVFNYKTSDSDRILLDRIIKKGIKLSKNVNKGSASNSVNKRNLETVKNNAISGLLAEFVWKDFLNYNDIVVKETVFENASNQIDLLIVKTNKTIEVRSSFPRNGVKFALCHNKYQFDVIGPYSNNYKPREIQKDYYVRVLYPFKSDTFLYRLKNDEFEVFLTGGADWQMFSDNNIVKIKSFIPEDELNIDRLNNKTNYRVVPFSNALDTIQIIQLIKNNY